MKADNERFRLSGRSVRILLAAICTTAGSISNGHAQLTAPDETEAQSSDDAARTYKLQLGLNFLNAGDLEDPFINLTRLPGRGWAIHFADGEHWDEQRAAAEGYLGEATGLPIALPENATHARAAFIAQGRRHFPDHYAGDYIFEWDGDAYGFIKGQPRELQIREGDNRLRFRVTRTSKNSLSPSLSMIGEGGVTGVRVYRAEHEDLIKSGKVWNPKFIEFVKRYDVLRTMDMQHTNSSSVRSFDDVARPEDAIYGRGFRVQWPPPKRYGPPYEILFDLGVKAERSIWLHIPPLIGSPKHQADPTLRVDNNPDAVDPKKLKELARANVDAILTSPEWEKFAAAFVDRLVASEYPPDRPLYIELGNEIWNFAFPFTRHTHYAWGIGLGINPRWGARQGYGVLTARWMRALEEEISARSLSYNFVYVIASQTSSTMTTRQAYIGLKAHLRANGINPAPYVAKTGVALTNYHGGRKPYNKFLFGEVSGDEMVARWEQAIKDDPEGLKKRLHDYFVDSPESVSGTRRWILNRWRLQAKTAREEGARFIGAYEGGSHDVPPQPLMNSPVFAAWWKEYHWGPYGANVVRQVNAALIEEFPHAILSNYANLGVIGRKPWFDGHYAENTAMLEMWDEFAIPEDQR